MLNLITTLSIFLLIIFEIIVTVFCVKRLIKTEQYIDEVHIVMLEKAKIILEINDEIQKTIKKINKIIKFISNKKLLQTKRILMMAIDIIQIILLVKSLNLSKGAKSVNYKMLKNLAYAKIGQETIRKILDFTQNLCAI